MVIIFNVEIKKCENLSKEGLIFNIDSGNKNCANIVIRNGIIKFRASLGDITIDQAGKTYLIEKNEYERVSVI